MKEILHNGYIKIKPVTHQSFVSSGKETYEEIGEVLAIDWDLAIAFENTPTIGSKVKFDSWTAKKYPVEGKDGEYEWYVKFSEIVSHVE